MSPAPSTIASVLGGAPIAVHRASKVAVGTTADRRTFNLNPSHAASPSLRLRAARTQIRNMRLHVATRTACCAFLTCTVARSFTWWRRRTHHPMAKGARSRDRRSWLSNTGAWTMQCRNVRPSYLIIPHHTSSYLIIPHHTSSYLIIPHHTSSYLIIPRAAKRMYDYVPPSRCPKPRIPMRTFTRIIHVGAAARTAV